MEFNYSHLYNTKYTESHQTESAAKGALALLASPHRVVLPDTSLLQHSGQWLCNCLVSAQSMNHWYVLPEPHNPNSEEASRCYRILSKFDETLHFR